VNWAVFKPHRPSSQLQWQKRTRRFVQEIACAARALLGTLMTDAIRSPRERKARPAPFA